MQTELSYLKANALKTEMVKTVRKNVSEKIACVPTDQQTKNYTAVRTNRWKHAYEDKRLISAFHETSSLKAISTCNAVVSKLIARFPFPRVTVIWSHLVPTVFTTTGGCFSAFLVQAVLPGKQSVRSVGGAVLFRGVEPADADREVIADVLVRSVRHAAVARRRAVVVAAAVDEVGTDVLRVAAGAGRVVRGLEATVVHADAVPVVAVDAVGRRGVGEAVRQGADGLRGDLIARSPRCSGRRRHQHADHHAHHDAGQQSRAHYADDEEYLQTPTTSTRYQQHTRTANL